MVEEPQNKLYVGNLPYNMDQDALKELFAQIGEVTDSIIITDKFSGRSKGFGFVTMVDAETADKAVKEMNGKDVSGRAIVVNIARPMKPRFENKQ